jgi:hypothetical protein
MGIMQNRAFIIQVYEHGVMAGGRIGLQAMVQDGPNSSLLAELQGL